MSFIFLPFSLFAETSKSEHFAVELYVKYVSSLNSLEDLSAEIDNLINPDLRVDTQLLGTEGRNRSYNRGAFCYYQGKVDASRVNVIGKIESLRAHLNTINNPNYNNSNTHEPQAVSPLELGQSINLTTALLQQLNLTYVGCSSSREFREGGDYWDIMTNSYIQQLRSLKEEVDSSLASLVVFKCGDKRTSLFSPNVGSCSSH